MTIDLANQIIVEVVFALEQEGNLIVNTAIKEKEMLQKDETTED